MASQYRLKIKSRKLGLWDAMEKLGNPPTQSGQPLATIRLDEVIAEQGKPVVTSAEQPS